MSPGNGDGWIRCGLGHRHWGRYGAAGLLLWHTDPAGRRWVLLQHRAAWSHHGGTWGLPGGARDREESAEQAALREAREEAGLDAGGVVLHGVSSDDHGGWIYDTVIGAARALLDVRPTGGESAAVRWLAESDVAGLPLHPGFAASWPLLRSR